MAAGGIAANAVISRVSTRISVIVQNEIQADIYNKVIFTDWESLNAFRSGDILNRLTSDAGQVASSVIGYVPQGMETVIGEHETGLSEGQAQRLTIARAVLTDAPILLFDEAILALDEETEARVLRNILECGKNRTCIVTSHRPGVMSISQHIYEIRGRGLCRRK